MTSLALFVAEKLQECYPYIHLRAMSAEGLSEVIASAIAEHKKANAIARTDPAGTVDNYVPDSGEDGVVIGPRCQKCGKPEGQCPTLPFGTPLHEFTPADPTKEKP